MYSSLSAPWQAVSGAGEVFVMESGRAVLKHSNESAFQTSLPTGYNQRGNTGTRSRACHGNSAPVLIYLFVLEFPDLLVPRGPIRLKITIVVSLLSSAQRDADKYREERPVQQGNV